MGCQARLRLSTRCLLPLCSLGGSGSTGYSTRATKITDYRRALPAVLKAVTEFIKQVLAAHPLYQRRR